jgi:hypothetical protein
MLSEHTSPGSAAGFGYQFQRALHWLARSPAGYRVGIETDDDVSVRTASDLPHALEQDKHSIRGQTNPFADRSIGLWKTLSIWVSAVSDGELIVKEAILLLATNGSVSPGLATQIAAAEDDTSAKSCIDALEVVGENPSETIRPYVEIVLDSSRRAALVQVIRRCKLIDGNDASAGDSLIGEIASVLQLPAWHSAQADSVVEELLGWMHRCALECWRSGKQYWVERDHFVNQLHAILDRRHRAKARERAENLLPVDDVSLGAHRGKGFVRQLHLITDDATLVDGAIRDFLRCGIEKLRLSAEGNITDDDWLALESELISRWQKIHPRILRMSREKSEEDQGFEVFVETTEGHRARLAGQETEQTYLTSGTYHRLANTAVVGWHPRFREMLGARF